ncbi:hypothetical protein [Natrinema sp. SYSU A 869]|uniref:hypothetical protein n=1 Tax=Natrinema sp. SYSU A 869 TaxID=2871694 RepID=UPI001CA41DBB|nr:hypothetical protein [Natrinema sp. SYSU A 869]
MLLGGTDAFSRAGTNRFVSVRTADDSNGLLGLDVTASVQSGMDDQRLVDVTNNADGTIAATLTLSEPSQGSISETDLSLDSGSTRSVHVSVEQDSPTGSDALPFEISASNEDVSISVARSVAVNASPAFKQQIRDYTQHGNAAFGLSYRVSRLPNFERVEIEVENVDAGHIGQESYVESDAEQTVSYPPSGGSDGGAGGDTYEFRFRVYDQSGEVTELSTEVRTTANGENPPGDDLSDEDDPKLVGFTVTNDEQHTNNRFTVEYEVDRLEEFRDVQVEFDNTENDWSDRTKSNDAAPTGSVAYPEAGQRQGGVNGNTYDVAVEVYNQGGIPVDSGTVSIEAGSNETVDWP